MERFVSGELRFRISLRLPQEHDKPVRDQGLQTKEFYFQIPRTNIPGIDWDGLGLSSCVSKRLPLSYHSLLDALDSSGWSKFLTSFII